MLQIGIHHHLIVSRQKKAGLYLINEVGDEVLLPTKYIPEGVQTGDRIRVFVYLDNEGRPIATTLEPYLTLNRFGYLQVSQVNRFGAFMDWGVEKELLIPFKEQADKMERGRSYVIFLHEDTKTNRLIGSARLGKFVRYENISVEEGEEVEALVTKKTPLGVMVIVNHLYQGLLYKSETFATLRPGEVVKAYVKKVREDGKLDLTLQQAGYAHVEPNAQKILELLGKRGGFINLHDKSDPQEIQLRLEMSKKTFKKAIGALYKQRLIEVEPGGIRLVNQNTP